jgi:hypothetical protein
LGLLHLRYRIRKIFDQSCHNIQYARGVRV